MTDLARKAINGVSPVERLDKEPIPEGVWNKLGLVACYNNCSHLALFQALLQLISLLWV